MLHAASNALLLEMWVKVRFSTRPLPAGRFEKPSYVLKQRLIGLFTAARRGVKRMHDPLTGGRRKTEFIPFILARTES
jgi:hypothetical protein